MVRQTFASILLMKAPSLLMKGPNAPSGKPRQESVTVLGVCPRQTPQG